METETEASTLTLSRRWPWATWAITLANLYVHLQTERAMRWGIVERVLTDYAFHGNDFSVDASTRVAQLVSHTFVHGNWPHFIGNFVFFLLFGPVVERVVGSVFFLVGYFLWGVVSALTQGVFTPFTDAFIGSSGAISGAVGAFFVLFPILPAENTEWSLIGRWMGRFPSFILALLWFLAQLQGGFQSLMPTPVLEKIVAVGYWAHIGGFAAGALSMAPFVFPLESYLSHVRRLFSFRKKTR